MTGNPAVIATFQAALPLESHLNLQYRMDQKILKFMGLKKLACKLHEFGDAAHLALAQITDQLLFLTGDQVGGDGYSVPMINQPKTVTDMFTQALAMQVAICMAQEDAVVVAMEQKDDASRNVIKHILKQYRLIQGWMEQQLRLISMLGEAEYIAEKL